MVMNYCCCPFAIRSFHSATLRSRYAIIPFRYATIPLATRSFIADDFILD